MTEAERLQQIVLAQEKELRRLRKLLSIARVAMADYYVEDGALKVVVTAIGVDEYYFTEQAKPGLAKIAEALTGVDCRVTGPITDATTGDEIQGAVSPEHDPEGR